MHTLDLTVLCSFRSYVQGAARLRGSEGHCSHVTVLFRRNRSSNFTSTTNYSLQLASPPPTARIYQPPRMADRKSAYGNAAASDTDFRRTWDRSEYEAKAKEGEKERREEAKARYEAKLEGKKWHKPVDFSSLDSTSARGSRLDVASMVGKSTLVPAGAGVGKRGKGAGFYCEACDLTYKDNVQYIEHLNSKQHLVNTGQSGEVKRATLQDVRERLEMLKARKRQQEEDEKQMAEVDIKERIKKAEEIDEKEREEKRRKRNEKRKAAKADRGIKQEDEWEGRLGIIS